MIFTLHDLARHSRHAAEIARVCRVLWIVGGQSRLMRISPYITALVLTAFAVSVCGQVPTAPVPQPAHIAGTVTDTNGAIIPGASVALEGSSVPLQSVQADANGFFKFDNIPAGTGYQVIVSAKGFVGWNSSTISLSPGQFDILTNVTLPILGDAASVIVFATPVELATEQVKVEEHQRVLGFIPNFYVSYDKHPAPLSSKLKFELALKISYDPVTFAGTAFLAATNQASHYPDYVEGMKGYGQRVGSVYLNGLTDIIVGGAVLPSVLHQDPRYFYQGTGSTKSRLLHALSSPILCRGDNGREQPNYSSIGGYLAAGSIANAYYPEANRGPHLLLNIFAVDLGANVANGVLQEFVLRKLTRNGKGGPQP